MENAASQNDKPQTTQPTGKKNGGCLEDGGTSTELLESEQGQEDEDHGKQSSTQHYRKSSREIYQPLSQTGPVVVTW